MEEGGLGRKYSEQYCDLAINYESTIRANIILDTFEDRPDRAAAAATSCLVVARKSPKG